MSKPRIIRLMVLLGVSLILLVVSRWHRRRDQEKVPIQTNAIAVLNQFEAREAERYWGPELWAQKFGRIIEDLWDELNRSTNKWAVLGKWQFELVLPQFANAVMRNLPHGIKEFSPSGPGWPETISRIAASGWELQQCEFRQIAFYTNQAGRGVASTYYVSGHLTNHVPEERAMIEGNMKIWWNERPDLPPIREVDARELKIRTRKGPPAFQSFLNAERRPPTGSYFIDPLLVWDLDGDSRSEIILAAENHVFRNASSHPAGWADSKLLKQDPGLIFTAILGDFDGDDMTDFLCANFDGLLLYSGDAKGKFTNAPVQVWQAQPRLKYGQALTAGDIDGDGDLDLFLGQYKVPYTYGQMPFPYFDANDGYPSFLLINDGHGHFKDGTSVAGLGAKRARRVYSASFVDLDKDGDLDLVVTSDFAGLDAYENDGKGQFPDITKKWFGSKTSGFGMAHAFADFNHDGLLDVLMIGMNSPTADRLESLNLSRPYPVDDSTMRARSTYGNRLFFGKRGGGFEQTPVSDYVARTGWSWGVAAEDFDNDGFPDIYIANGHETKDSVREYEQEFWLHDIYVGNSQENSLAQTYFQDKYGRTRKIGTSYGGYEKNRFLLSLGGTNFVEVAHLFGLALELDSRNVVPEDLNGDGKLDLIVTTFEAWPRPRQTLRVYLNRLPDTGHWLEVSGGNQKSLFGARIDAGGGTHALAAGDSYRSQRTLKAHVGLGQMTNAVTIEVRPVQGDRVVTNMLEIDRIGRVWAK